MARRAPFTLAVAVLLACAACTSDAGTAASSGPSSQPPSSAPTTTATATATRTVTRSPSTTPTASTASSSGSGCATSQLRLTGGDGNGAGGTQYLTFFFVNTGARCTLYGYPGVSVIDDDGVIVQKAAVRNPRLGSKGAPHLITLRDGDRAQFIVSVSETDPDPACPGPRFGARLRVYPPNQKQPLYRNGRFQACSLRVNAVSIP